MMTGIGWSIKLALQSAQQQIKHTIYCKHRHDSVQLLFLSCHSHTFPKDKVMPWAVLNVSLLCMRLQSSSSKEGFLHQAKKLYCRGCSWADMLYSVHNKMTDFAEMGHVAGVHHRFPAAGIVPETQQRNDGCRHIIRWSLGNLISNCRANKQGDTGNRVPLYPHLGSCSGLINHAVWKLSNSSLPVLQSASRNGLLDSHQPAPQQFQLIILMEWISGF